MISITSASDALGRTTSFTYDELNRLKTINFPGTSDDASFIYDDADNMVFNSGLCVANPNLAYPTPPVTVARPHAPTTICGTSVTYDANGNTTSYDADGSGPILLRA